MKPIVYAALAGWTLWASIGGAQAAQIRSPFLDHPVDLAALESVLSAQPEDLVQAVQKMGVKIYLLPAKHTGGVKTSPFLSALPRLTEDQYARFGMGDVFTGSVDGLYIASEDPCCDLKEDFIAMNEAAAPLTLVHESVHYLFSAQRTAAEREIQRGAEAEIERDRRALKFRFDKVFRDLSLLSNPLWRRDLVSALEDYTLSLGKILTVSLSEEILIERALQTLVKEGSPLHDPGRLEAGERYAQNTLQFIRVLISDGAFIADWLQGEFKVLEGEMELAETYRYERKFADLRKKLESLAEKYARLRDFRLAP